MNRALYVLAAVVAMALIPLAQSVDLLRPRHTGAIEAPVAAPPVTSTQDATTSAVDDLAAWPASAVR
ncbi:MAG: hypothetical protein NDJ19_06215 [Ramlibacter sp.]|nr:hypothetical protein [Ramlibacter sp.]